MRTSRDISNTVIGLAQQLGQDPSTVLDDYHELYAEHREEHGSYAPLIGTEFYDKKMEERHGWILERICLRYGSC